MLHFFFWYLLVSLLGWLTFPLAYRLFPALADRGFSLARALGILVWGYVFWMMGSLGIIQNDGGGLLLALALLIVLSILASWKMIVNRQYPSGTMLSIVSWLKSNLRLIITVEVLFFLAFAAWAFVRASNPNIEITGGEKTMELAFINAILHSPTFPPHDPWLSGYAISYYYFGYVMTAMLARATGTLGSVAHNLMSALIFALSFIGAYGILYNLLALWRNRQSSIVNRKSSIGLPLLGPLFLLFVSNLEGFLVVLHRKGLFWTWSTDGKATSAFWSWLGILQMSDPPSHPGLFPDQFNWWWRASRVIQDLDLAKNSTEIIDEFPAFSYLLGDLHPHVLAMPFGLLAVAVALNLFLGGWKGETNLRFYRLPVHPAGLFFGALILGGLAFLNTWDILTGFALVAGAYVLARALEGGWTWKRLEDLFAFSVPTGLLAILLYLPFYAGFSSQAGGVLPNLVSPTRGAQLWVMFAPLFLALMAYLVYLWRAEKRPANWKLGFGIGLGLAVLLWIVSWGLALLAYKLQPGIVGSLINSQCSGSISLCFGLTLMRRLSYIGGLLTLLGLLGPALAFIVPIRDQQQTTDRPSSSVINPMPFVLMLIILGTLLVLAPDFVFLRDLFYNRSNTIFKFYYQAWLLWSLAAAFGAVALLQKLRGAWGWVYRIGLVLVLFMALVFPVLGLPDKTNDFQIPAFLQNLKAAQVAGDPVALQTTARVWTLDGGQLFQRQYPDDAAAARWLSTAPAGVIAEAVSKDAYSDYGRMAVYSGQPTVLGWWWHEYQWRGSVSDLVSPIQNLTCRANFSYDSRRMRSDDVSCLYETSSWDEASEIIAQYNIRYVVVGTLERRDYRVNELKFQQHLTTVFQQGQVVIYEVP
jgi:YYY domain-containing protein